MLCRDLVHALRKRRPGIPIDSFKLHQDNAPPHTAGSTQLEIGLLGFEVISHPPYSPDLAPFDFAIFLAIKLQLKGRRFENLKKLQTATNAVIKHYKPAWYDNIFQQWVYRHRRRIECRGCYYEKQWGTQATWEWTKRSMTSLTSVNSVLPCADGGLVVQNPMPSKPNESIYLHKNSLLDAEIVAVYSHVVFILISCLTLKIWAQFTNFLNSPRIASSNIWKGDPLEIQSKTKR